MRLRGLPATCLELSLTKDFLRELLQTASDSVKNL